MKIARRSWTAVAVFALVAVLVAPVAVADDPPAGSEPPQARIGPPIGVTSDETPSLAGLFLQWLETWLGPASD